MVIDKEKKKEWLRAIRQFKRTVEVCRKLGVIDSVCDTIAKERNNSMNPSAWVIPHWDDPVWIDFLASCIKNNHLHDTLLRAFVRTAEVVFLNNTRQPDAYNVIKAINFITRKYSKQLRKAFGVIID